jgi:hypothetical protein
MGLQGKRDIGDASQGWNEISPFPCTINVEGLAKVKLGQPAENFIVNYFHIGGLGGWTPEWRVSFWSAGLRWKS